MSLLAAASLVFTLQVEAKPPQGDSSALPPGLQKKAARGGQLPTGWERKLQVGRPLERGLYDSSRPVSSTLRAQLPAGRSGTVEVRLEGKVVRLMKATHEIVEIFEVDRFR